MKSELTTLEANKVKLSVEVDEDEIDSHVDQAFRRLAKEIRLPGFRPGKAPRKVLEARIGSDYARGEALREALPEYYRQAILEHDVDVIAPPDLDITEGESAGRVAFEAIVEIRPEVTVAGYNGLRVEIPVLAATDDEVEEQLTALRNQFGERVPAERPAIDGDYVTMDISATYEGEPLDSLTADDYTYEVGAGFVVDELDGELRGAKIGDIKEFSADHPSPDEEGRLTFRILVKGIEEKALPPVDDDFAEEASEFDTAEELVADTRARIEAAKRAQANRLVRERTATALAELVIDEIPDALVEDQVQHQLQDMAMRMARQGIELDKFLEATGQSVDDLREQLREPAEEASKVDLALRAVAVAEAIEVSDDELWAEIDESAAALGQDAEALRRAFEEGGQLSVLRADLRKRKAMELVLESVQIVDENGKPVDRADLEDTDTTTELDESETDTEHDTETDTEDESGRPAAIDADTDDSHDEGDPEDSSEEEGDD